MNIPKVWRNFVKSAIIVTAYISRHKFVWGKRLTSGLHLYDWQCPSNAPGYVTTVLVAITIDKIEATKFATAKIEPLNLELNALITDQGQMNVYQMNVYLFIHRIFLSYARLVKTHQMIKNSLRPMPWENSFGSWSKLIMKERQICLFVKSLRKFNIRFQR